MLRRSAFRTVLFALVLLFGLRTAALAQGQLSFNSGNFGTQSIGSIAFELLPSGGAPPYVFSYAPGAKVVPGTRVVNSPEVPSYFPASSGGLVGILNTPGTYSTMIQLKDSAGMVVTGPVTLTVSPLDIIGWTPNGYGVGDAVSIQFYGAGGTAPYTFSLASGTLPPGLALSSSGLISGTATTAGNWNFSIKIQDSGGQTFTRGYGLFINNLRISNLPSRILSSTYVNQSYSYQFIAAGGTPPYTFALGQGQTLPTGLTLSSRGLLSGTPTSSYSAWRFDLVVSDSAGSTLDLRLALNILPQTPSPLTVSSASIPDATIGDNSTTGIYASGGFPPYTFSVAPGSSLPAGSVLVPGLGVSPSYWDPDSGDLRATITTPGTYNFVIEVTDSAGNTATRPFTWHVTDVGFLQTYTPNSGPTEAVFGVPFTFYMIPIGGSGTYTTSSVEIPLGMSVNNNGVVSGTPDEIGTYLPLFIKLTDARGVNYTANGYMFVTTTTGSPLNFSGGDFGTVQNGISFNDRLDCSSSPLASPDCTVTLVSGTLPPGMLLLNTADFNTFGDVTAAGQLAGFPTTPGTYTFIVKVTDSAGDIGQRQITIHISSLAFVNGSIANGTVGSPYLQSFDVRGGSQSYTFSIALNSNLPTGLGIDPHTGNISGTPTTTFSGSVPIQVIDNSTGDTLVRYYSFNIYAFKINGADILPTAIEGQPYSYTFTATGPGPYIWTSPSIVPPNTFGGLTLDPNTGTLSGIPTLIGTYTLSITAGNGSTAVTRNFALFGKTIASSSVLTGLPTQYLGDFQVGTSVNLTLSSFGGTPPYTVALLPPTTLPPGLALVPAQLYSPTSGFGRYAIAGIPTVPGNYTFRVRFVDSGGLAEDRNVSLNVTTLGIVDSNTYVPYATFNTPYSVQLYGVGGTVAYTYALSNIPYNVLPPGMSLSAAGVLSGTPTATGFFSFRVDMASGASNQRQSTVFFQVYSTSVTQTQILSFSLGPALPDLSLGRGSERIISASGGAGPYTWTLTAGNLPPGLALLAGASLPAGYSSNYAFITGAPTMAGTYTFSLRVDDSTGLFAVQTATVVVTPIAIGQVDQSFSQQTIIPAGQVGKPFTFTISPYGGRPPYSYTTTYGLFLPTVSPSVAFMNGVLSLTPNEAGNFAIPMLITDADGKTLRASLSWTVYPAGAPIGLDGISPFQSLPSATLGAPFSFSLNDLLLPGYGTPPIAWSVTAGSLPAGLSIVPGTATTSATISGTPRAASGSFSLTATDANGLPYLAYSDYLSVTPQGVAPPSGSLPPGVAGSPYSQTITAAGGTPPYRFQLALFSDLPAGLTLSSGGVLSGTPTSVGPHLLNVQITDAGNNVFLARYVLTIAPQGAIISALNVTPASITVGYNMGDPSPAPIQISISSTASNFSYSVGASGGSWLTEVPATGSTPGTATATINPAGLTVGAYNGAITITSAAASNSPVAIPVTLNVNPPSCLYSLSAYAGTLPYNNGSGSFTVTTTAACDWTATAKDNWITFNSAGSGTGTGTVSFVAATNSSATTRTTTITVQGLVYTVTQFGAAGCSFTLAPSTVSVSAAAGSAPVTVNASASSCAWTATPADTWVTVANPNNGTGTGSVTISVAQNPLATTRTSSVSIGGQTFTISQAGVNCNYSLSSTGASIAAGGGSSSFNVTVPAGCNWDVDPGPTWVAVTSPTGSSGSGGGSITLSIAANSTTVPRGATVLAGGQTYQITQAGLPCSFSLGVNNPYQPVGGGSGSIAISAIGIGCNWVASSNANWVVLSASSGSGNYALSFTVPKNLGTNARSATLTVAGQNIVVNQAASLCNYQFRSPSGSAPSAGGSSSIGVIAPTGCAWTAQSNASWITITGGNTSSGTDDVTFNVDVNSGATDRTGTMTIAGQDFAVTQPAAPCTVTLGSSSVSAGEFGGGSSLSYTTSVSGCVVNVQAFSSWLTITGSSSGTNPTIYFNVDPNASAARSGVIRVGDTPFTVNQNRSTCAYTLMSYGMMFGQPGGNGNIPMGFSPPMCGPAPVLVNGPPGMITLTSVGEDSVAQTYTQNYTASIYQSFINYVRAAQILIGGQIYTVKQQSWISQ